VQSGQLASLADLLLLLYGANEKTDLTALTVEDVIIKRPDTVVVAKQTGSGH
jgi:hypothetical protein